MNAKDRALKIMKDTLGNDYSHIMLDVLHRLAKVCVDGNCKASFMDIALIFAKMTLDTHLNENNCCKTFGHCDALANKIDAVSSAMAVLSIVEEDLALHKTKPTESDFSEVSTWEEILAVQPYVNERRY